MKLYKSLFFIISLFCFSLNLSAQKSIPVYQMKASPLTTIHNPILIDSIDVNRKSFEKKNLLQTFVNFETVRQSKIFINAEMDSIFDLKKVEKNEKRPSQDNAVQLFMFRLDPDRYSKAELVIKATDMLEVYVNGKKEKTKESMEADFSKAKDVKIDLTLEPRQYEVIIKRLTAANDTAETKLKAEIKLKKEYESAEISILSKEGKRSVNIYDIMEGTRASDASLSPTGNYYIMTTRTVFPGGKSTTSYELKTTKDNQTIYRFPSGTNPSWLNNKDQLVYSRSAQNNRDIVILDIPSFRETVIAKDIKFGSYQISPDEQFILITQREEIPADKGDLKRVLSINDRSGGFRGRNSVYLYSIKEQILQQITFGQTSTYPTDISPDSKKAIIISSEETMERRPFRKYTLMELNFQTLALDTLFTSSSIYSGQYSPDMKQLLLLGDADAFDGIGKNTGKEEIVNTYDRQLFLYNLSDKSVKPITKYFNPNVKNTQWSLYDNQIYILSEDKDFVRVYSYDTKADKFTLLDLPEEVISSFQVSDTQPIALFRGQSNANSSRVYSYNLKSKKSTLLEDPFNSQLQQLDLNPAKRWTFTSSLDNTEIEGRYYLPPNFDPNKKYPMIVYYYGGTNPTSRNFESGYPLQVYAALGYVVYNLQPSGATGFGQEFSSRHVNAWGKRTADEIIEGTKTFCKEHSFVDKTKIGCVGASYGGFMTQYLQTQTDIFAAAISHAGISALSSYWGEGYWGVGYSAVASADSYPWNNPELYVKQSPLFNADKINTPLLLLHGTVDTNVPVGESIQMYNALKILGKEVELVLVENENHGVTDYKKRIEWNKTMYAWFAKWLKDQPEWWDALYPKR